MSDDKKMKIMCKWCNVSKIINIKPTTTSALTKKSSGMFNDKPAINNPIRMMLDVCPIPQSAPLKDEIMVSFLKSSFLELLVLLLFFNSCVETALRWSGSKACTSPIIRPATKIKTGLLACNITIIVSINQLLLRLM